MLIHSVNCIKREFQFSSHDEFYFVIDILPSDLNVISKAQCRTITIACIQSSESFIWNRWNFSTEKEMPF